MTGTWWLRRPTAALGLVAAMLAPAGAAQAGATRNAPEDAAYDRYVSYQGKVIDVVDGFWVSALAGTGVNYSSPRVRIADRGSNLKSECGRKVADPVDAGKEAYPAFYCRQDRTVYLSSGWMYRAIFPSFARGGVAAVIAHEFGHHVQRTIGIADPSTRRQELQADCLAGIWVRGAVNGGKFDKSDVDNARRALRALGDTKVKSEAHHGTPKERSRWFNRGYRSGDAYVCNH